MDNIKSKDANFPTGSSGLIAVDKIGNQILFLDPETYATTLTLDAFAPRVHELAISPDHKTAYVPIYGDGIHGKNPHPGHLIALFDLEVRRHAGDFSTYPYLAPHGLRWRPRRQLYCVCENSGAVLEMGAGSGKIEHVMEVGSDKAHRIEVTPDGSKLYTENEEDTFGSVIDLKARKRIKKFLRRTDWRALACRRMAEQSCLWMRKSRCTFVIGKKFYSGVGGLSFHAGKTLSGISAAIVIDQVSHSNHHGAATPRSDKSLPGARAIDADQRKWVTLHLPISSERGVPKARVAIPFFQPGRLYAGIFPPHRLLATALLVTGPRKEGYWKDRMLRR